MMKTRLSLLIGVLMTSAFAASAATPGNALSVDASKPITTPESAHLKMGTQKGPGGVISVDSRSLLRDGKPWLPVMGEFHYSRYPESEWRDELLKMKAGGVDVVATYVFWIHHEEDKGKWDWRGRRSLRNFVTLCGEVGMPIVVRGGPWAHGEARNGGIPDWLEHDKSIKIRSDDPAYLARVKELYEQISEQLKGQLWKDGGPVIGFQIENEYHGLASHLMTLKKMAIEAGIDVPFYTKTAWPALASPVPLGEMLPLFGAYADGFWDRSLAEMPGGYRRAFLFEPVHIDTTITSEQLKHDAHITDDMSQYPFLGCEIGGGMVVSYHRRIKMAPDDVAATALVKIGSGNNLQGFYMYHGGTNPEGKLTELNEAQSIGGYNDLPVMSYEFQAPLGEFGQVHPQYHLLRKQNMFLHDFGQQLAIMPAWMPAGPKSPEDTGTLRWSVRSDGRSGFVFINNYQRSQEMPAKTGVRFSVALANGKKAEFPENPVTIPANTYAIWPFNMDLGGVTLQHATAQPMCRMEADGITWTVFSKTSGVLPEFTFEEGVAVEEAKAMPWTGVVQFQRITGMDGKRVGILVLDEATSLRSWKTRLAGRDRLVISDADLLFDGDSIKARTAGTGDSASVVIFPPIDEHRNADGALFSVASPRLSPQKSTKAACKQIADAGPARDISLGSAKVAAEPSSADFEKAAVWQINIPDTGKRDVLLRIHYTGDAARIYKDGKLLTDNFYNGDPFEVGLKRYGNPTTLELKILPLRKDAPIYLPKTAVPKYNDAGIALDLQDIEIIETREAQLRVK